MSVRRSVFVALVVVMTPSSVQSQRPNVTNGIRGAAVPTSDVARQVTGAPEHLQAFADGYVAGSGAWVGIAPVEPANGLSYPVGTTLSGNTITLPGVPQRLWFEIQLGGWAEDLDTYQIAVDQSSFGNGSGADLVRPTVPCSPATDGGWWAPQHPDCVAAYGPNSKCTGSADPGLCDIGFQDRAHPHFAINGISGVNQANLLFGSTRVPCPFACNIDDGRIWYGGNLVLEATLDASGEYRVGILMTSATYFLGHTGRLDIAEYREAVVRIPRGRCCNFTDQSCLDGVTIAECDDQIGRTRFVEDATCDGVDCIPTDGACCDRRPGRGGACTVREEVDCPGDGFHTFTLNTECEEVVCEEATGACCDRIDWQCIDGLKQAECTDIAEVWTPDAWCGEIVCPPEFEAIPAVSEWGLVILAISLLAGTKVYYGRRAGTAGVV